LPASKAVSGAEEFAIHRIPIGDLASTGPHHLAISVHNSDPTSSDLRLAGITLVELAEEPPAAVREKDSSPPAP
jgi:hypothetical protein